MPELPEVETVRVTLKQFIIGKRITDIIVFYDAIIKEPLQKFKSLLINQRFSDIRRYGKYLLFDLDEFTLISHLRMEGKYYLRKNLNELTKHEHVVFVLDDGTFLSYHDIRKFGTMELVPLYQETTCKSIQTLGKEVNDPSVDVEYLYPKIKNANRPIKSILLDQRIITGLGNIYVDETLYMAKIHPLTLGSNLSYYQIEKIAKASKVVIKKAIELGGTTIRTYHSTLGVDGRFQNELNVHTLVGQSCKVCNDTIIKIKVGGRGTYLCPTCQRKNPPLIIGLTGGISSGKSMISKWFKNKHVTVIDADKIYNLLLKNNKIMYNMLINAFGKEIENGHQIDRKKLGSIIYNDNQKRNQLNDITHPFVLDEMNKSIDRAIKRKRSIIVLDVPLLFEAHMEHLMNLTILVYVNKPMQIERLMQRDQINYDLALLKVNAQMDLELKKNYSDIIIDNSSSEEVTKQQFNEIIIQLRRDGIVI